MSEKLRDSRGNEIKFKDKIAYVNPPVLIVRQIRDGFARVSYSGGTRADFFVSKKELSEKFVLKKE